MLRDDLKQAQISVYSILRDWIKGQVTAVEVGMLSFEGAFLGQILLPSGETVLERLEQVSRERWVHFAKYLPSAKNPHGELDRAVIDAGIAAALAGEGK